MTTCAIRRGFFVLRDCGEPAAAACVSCSRPVCPRHQVPAAGAPALPGARQPVICLECHAKQNEDDPGIFVRRRRYYGTGYYPIYIGDGGSDYDDYDVRSFDAADGDAGDAGDAPGGDGPDVFGDDDGDTSFGDS